MVVVTRTPVASSSSPITAAPAVNSYAVCNSPHVRPTRAPNADVADALLPWLRSMREAIDCYEEDPTSASALRVKCIAEDCIGKFSGDVLYRDDPRFLKIWILYADAIQDFDGVYLELEKKHLFLRHSVLYEAYAAFFVAKGDLGGANHILRVGISRGAEPLERLRQMLSLLTGYTHLSTEEDQETKTKSSTMVGHEVPSPVDPWSTITISQLLKRINTDITKYRGYHQNNKAYSGKVSLTSLQISSRNKVVELGGRKYHIKGCSGTGAFAKVYKAHVDGNGEDVVALKVQQPAFPWEFYIYRQLDMRIPDVDRANFGYAQKVHLFSDLSVLVCDYMAHGTLQDAINSHLVTNKHMDEVLCIYYTIEMLYILEVLHKVRIIHGDFKPDNMLVRYPREDLKPDTLRNRAQASQNQGLCLVDWGRAIDQNLFLSGTEFYGDCRTSGFRCVQMREGMTWTYQVDTYGLCVIAHMMLHGAYMNVEKKVNANGSHQYQSCLPLKRYWNVELWNNLFSTLLNIDNGCDVLILTTLRKSFEDFLCSSVRRVDQLNHLLAKQKASLCSS